jgi:hypothetical protein
MSLEYRPGAGKGEGAVFQAGEAERKSGEDLQDDAEAQRKTAYKEKMRTHAKRRRRQVENGGRRSFLTAGEGEQKELLQKETKGTKKDEKLNRGMHEKGAGKF